SLLYPHQHPGDVDHQRAQGRPGLSAGALDDPPGRRRCLGLLHAWHRSSTFPDPPRGSADRAPARGRAALRPIMLRIILLGIASLAGHQSTTVPGPPVSENGRICVPDCPESWQLVGLIDERGRAIRFRAVLDANRAILEVADEPEGKLILHTRLTSADGARTEHFSAPFLFERSLASRLEGQPDGRFALGLGQERMT